MTIRPATVADQKMWDLLVAGQEAGSCLQSWQWGEMQLKLGVQSFRLVVESAGVIVAVALVLKRDLPFGQSWLYVPRGPIMTGVDTPAIWQLFQERVRQLAEEQNSMFVRIDPAWQASDPSAELILQSEWKKSEREVQPRHTLLLDITQSEEQLLAQMHSKTRYNLGLAERKGVTVRWSRDPADLSPFFALALEVMSRSQFRFHTHEYYEAMVEATGIGDIALAEYKGEVLAAHILLTFGPTMTYAHGASTMKHRELMAPYLLQWESIKLAQERGCQTFDFFGIAPPGAADSHSWSGITRFKTGFGGRRADYVGAYDLILNPAHYTLFNLARRLRGVAR